MYQVQVDGEIFVAPIVINAAGVYAVSYTHLASVSEDQMIMALKTMANNVVPMPNIPEMDVMWSVTDDLLAAVNKRGEDVQTACDAHQKEALEQISAMQ